MEALLSLLCRLLPLRWLLLGSAAGLGTSPLAFLKNSREGAAIASLGTLPAFHPSDLQVAIYASPAVSYQSLILGKDVSQNSSFSFLN